MAHHAGYAARRTAPHRKKMNTIKTILAELFGDRLIQLGTGSSSLSLYGASQVNSAPPAWISHATAYLGLYATIIGAATATVTFIYAVLKIRRMLRKPSALE